MNPVYSISSSTLPNPPPEIKGGTTLSHEEIAKLWEAAKQLEATFSNYMLKDVNFGDKIDGKSDFANDVYGDMFKRSLAEQLARSGSLGIAKQIYLASANLAQKSFHESPSKSGSVLPSDQRFQTPTTVGA